MDHPPAFPVFPRGDLVFERPDLSRRCVFYENNYILGRDNAWLHFEHKVAPTSTVIVPVDEFNVSCLFADDVDDDNDDDEHDSGNRFEAEYGYLLYERLSQDAIAGQVWKGELVERVNYEDGTHYYWKQTPTEKLVAIKLIKSDSAWEREDYPHCSERPIQEIAAMQYLEKRIAQMDEHDHGEVCVDPISSIEDTWNRKMRIIRNYHVITSLDVLSCDKNMYIIMPYCDGGELLQLLNGRDRAFEEEEARKVLKQILKGLETLQKVEICHRDISIENIMTIGDDVALLIDFGVAMRIPYTRDSSGKRHRCLINSGGRPFGKVRPLSACYFCLLFLHLSMPILLMIDFACRITGTIPFT